MAFDKDTYYRETFTGLSLENETVKGVFFEECVFENCSFVTCTFERCRFLTCKLTGCILSAIMPTNTRFEDVSFVSCKAIGVNWSRAMETRKLRFRDSQVNYSNFRFAKLPDLMMVNCEARDSDFIEADLKGAVMKKTDFQNTYFSKTNLTNADFREAVNYSIDPATNILKKTKFSMPEVMGLLDSFDIIIE